VLLAIMGVGLGAGFALGGQAGAVAPDSAPDLGGRSSDLAAATPGPGVDLDGDGRPDLARPVDHALRGVDAYGSGAFGAVRDGGRRRHRGVDLVAAPGDPIRAPIAGTVTRLGAAYGGRNDLTYVEIVNPTTRYRARLFYVGPSVALGRDVAAGEVVGRAQDLTTRFPDGMTNHVHVELTGRHGGVIDPQVVLPQAQALDGRPAT
jgi:murein DD-endopeptidase MepM/ murein hydrolase activator NlpD